MALAALVCATIVDLAIAVLLVAVSGFVTGPGPESMHGDRLVLVGGAAMVIFCVAAPIVGFVMRAKRRPSGGAVIAWLPPALALVALLFPTPY